ncbi:hypothetical protein Ancab_025890 [Ancistrocladus abbreviatus]
MAMMMISTKPSRRLVCEQNWVSAGNWRSRIHHLLFLPNDEVPSSTSCLQVAEIHEKRSIGGRTSSSRNYSIKEDRFCDDDEENLKFVEWMREAQPYFHAHRGSTFVIVISGEILDSLHLHAILKVSLFSLSL